MWNKVLLALAATVLITAGVLLFTWAIVQTWGDFSLLFHRLRHRARAPWEDEHRALESLRDRVRHLDPELLPFSQKEKPIPREDASSPTEEA